MIRKMYSARDVKAEIFNAPMFLHTHGEAERAFAQATNDPQSMISKSPNDFDLYYLGDYDDQTGAVTPVTPPKLIANAATFVQVAPHQQNSTVTRLNA